jgi:hypothetical protein
MKEWYWALPAWLQTKVSKNQKSKSAPLNAARRNLAGESEGSKQIERREQLHKLYWRADSWVPAPAARRRVHGKKKQKDFQTGAACNTEQHHEKTKSLERESRPRSKEMNKSRLIS